MLNLSARYLHLGRHRPVVPISKLHGQLPRALDKRRGKMAEVYISTPLLNQSDNQTLSDYTDPGCEASSVRRTPTAVGCSAFGDLQGFVFHMAERQESLIHDRLS